MAYNLGMEPGTNNSHAVLDSLKGKYALVLKDAPGELAIFELTIYQGGGFRLDGKTAFHKFSLPPKPQYDCRILRQSLTQDADPGYIYVGSQQIISNDLFFSSQHLSGFTKVQAEVRNIATRAVQKITLPLFMFR